MEISTLEPVPTMEPSTLEPSTLEPATMEPATIKIYTMEPGTMEPGTMEPSLLHSPWYTRLEHQATGTAMVHTLKRVSLDAGCVHPFTTLPQTGEACERS